MRFRRCLGAACIFTALLFIFPNLVAAQSTVTGAVNGAVTDASSGLVAGATVTLTSATAGTVLTTQTNTSGTYSFALVKPGDYRVSVTQAGFKDATVATSVALGETTVTNVRLEVGSGAVTIEVTSQGPLLQTENANISTTIATAEIENLPNPGGDLSNIAQTAPGVAMNSAGSGYGNFSAFGMPGTANLFTLNGNDYNDPFLNLNNSGASNLLLGSNEIQEVSVISNAYTGQYGRQAGAQIDYATKSGGNAFHGDAVYYYNAGGMNATDYFAGYSPETNNQWAASLGGPIKKDKLFFFVNTEGLRYSLGSGGFVDLPTTAFENYVMGNIATLPTAPTATPFYQNIFNLYNSAPGYAAANANPQAASCGSLNGLSGGAIPNDACLGQAQEIVPNGNREWLLSGRVDWNINENNKIFARTKFDRGTQPTDTSFISPVFNVHSVQPQNEGQLNYTHIFSPNVVNNLVGSVLWYSALFTSPNMDAGTAAFPGLFFFTDIGSTCLGIGCQINAAGSAADIPQGRNVTQWGIVDDLSITHGNHGFKMGVNFRRDDVSDYRTSEGQIPNVGISALDFANDVMNPGGAGSAGDSVYQQFAVSPKQPLAIYSLGLYFQDEYRVNPRLKLTLALRADRNSSGVCQSDCGSAPLIPFAQMSHDATLPFDTITNPGSHNVLPGIERVVFQPRIGVAWTPFGDKTVIRAGIGQFSDLYPGTILDDFTTNFPQVGAFNYTAPGNFAFTDPGAVTSSVIACNTTFQSVYHSGGNLADYLAPNSNCALPNIGDVGKLLNPKYTEWNVEVQRTIGANTVVSVNYVGNRGYDEIMLNPLPNAFNPSGFGGLPAVATDARLGNVTTINNEGYSNYNGVTFSVQRNMWHGLMGRLNYSYGHALDTSSNGGILPFQDTFSQISVQDQINPNCLRCQNYSNADYDIRHNITANYLYQLPFHYSNRLVDAAVGGWTVSGTVYFHTGFPFSLLDSSDFLNQVAGNNGSGGVVLAQPVTAVQQSCTSPNAPCYLVDQFAGQGTNPPPSGFGDIRRNSFRGPDWFNTDLSIRKNFKVSERLGLQLGANAYNVLNHPNFQNPVNQTGFGPGTFGNILQTTAPPTTPYGAFTGSLASARILQVMAKMTF
jgi:hypothetical protein